MREPPMPHDAYQRIVDLRIEPFDLTEEEFIASHFYSEWRDFYGPGPLRRPYWLYQFMAEYGMTKDECWDMMVEIDTPRLRASYAGALADKDDYLLWKNDWGAWMAKQKAQAGVKPTQAKLWEVA